MNKGCKFLISCFISMCLLLCSCCNHSSRHSLIEELNSSVVAFPPGSPLNYHDSVFARIDIPDEVRLLAMGEATHGTREFAELRLATFQYLVKEKGYRALVKEFSYRGSLALNEYIQNGIGNLDSILSAYGWIHNNTESRAVFNWMLQWNKKVDEDDKIMFFGNDTQLDMWHMDALLFQMEKLDPLMYKNCKMYTYALAQFQPFEYQNMPYDRYVAVYNLLQKLKSAIISYYNMNRISCSTALTIQLANALIQSHKFLYHIYLKEASKNYRELHLAQNTLWVLQQLDQDSKMVLWAHNAHIANNPEYNKESGGSMGKHLKAHLHNKYYSIGLSFAIGSFVAVNLDTNGRDTPPVINTIRTSPPLNSVNHILNQARYPNYMLEVNSIQDEAALKSFLDTLRPFIDIGDLFGGTPDTHYTKEFDGITNVKQSFDMLVFFRKTNPIRL